MKLKNNNQKLPTLTIGTSALNEENMIGNFLHSILSQKQLSFRLDKIIINSDGSTDNTAKIVNSFKDDHILLIKNKERKGKTQRIQEICKLNTSDILLLLDADMLLGSTNTLENIVKKFGDQSSVGMVGLNTQPIKSNTFVGKMLYTWEKLWLEIRMRIKNGNIILSLRGGAFAIRGDLAKQFVIPQSIHQISEYLYHRVKQKGLLFKFASEALIYYRQTETFSDYISSLSRGDRQDITEFQKLFGKEILREYEVPLRQKYIGLFRMFLRSPLYLCLAIVFIQIARTLSKNKTNLDKHGFWPVTYSTKKAFSLKNV